MKRLIILISGAVLAASAYAAQTPAKSETSQSAPATSTSGAPAAKKHMKNHHKAHKPTATTANPTPGSHFTSAKK